MLIFIFATLAVLPLCASRCEEEMKQCSKLPTIEDFQKDKMRGVDWTLTYLDKDNQLGLYKNKRCVRDIISLLKGSKHEIQILTKSGKRGEKLKTVYSYGTYGSPTLSSVLIRYYKGQIGKLEDFRAVKTDYTTYVVRVSCAVDNDKAKFTGAIFQRNPYGALPENFVKNVEKEILQKSGVKLEFVKQSWDDCGYQTINN